MFKASSSRCSFSSALECTFSNFSIELFETAKFTGRIAPISCQGQLTKCHLNKCKPIKIMLFSFLLALWFQNLFRMKTTHRTPVHCGPNLVLHYTFLPSRYFSNGWNWKLIPCCTNNMQADCKQVQTTWIFIFLVKIFLHKKLGVGQRENWKEKVEAPGWLDIRAHIHSADPPDFDFLNRKLVVATPTPKMRLYKVLKWYEILGKSQHYI